MNYSAGRERHALFCQVYNPSKGMPVTSTYYLDLRSLPDLVALQEQQGKFYSQPIAPETYLVPSLPGAAVFKPGINAQSFCNARE